MTATSAHEEPNLANLDQVIERSGDLTDLIRSAWHTMVLPVEGLCWLTIEHAASIQLLIRPYPTSAMALLRPQFEGLVRAAWAQHAASDVDLSLLLAPLSARSQRAAKSLPGMADMLAGLEKSGPRGASALLARIRSRLGDGLNSYIHVGIHPFARRRNGHPFNLLIDM